MAGFQRRHDAFRAVQQPEGSHRLLVRHRVVFGPIDVFEKRMLRTHARIIEARGNGVGLDDLTVFVLHQIGSVAMQHAYLAGAQWRRVAAGFQSGTAASTPTSRTPASSMNG